VDLNNAALAEGSTLAVRGVFLADKARQVFTSFFNAV
jgi:hypothetical protein